MPSCVVSHREAVCDQVHHDRADLADVNEELVRELADGPRARGHVPEKQKGLEGRDRRDVHPEEALDFGRKRSGCHDGN